MEEPIETPQEGASPQEVSPQETSPQGVSPQELSPQEVSPQGVSPEEVSPQEAAKAQKKGARAQPEKKDPLQSLTLRVDFRVGSVTLPVEALADLAPDFTLTDMDGIFYPKIEAVCQNRVFAEGELVQIDGRLGVRILKIIE